MWRDIKDHQRVHDYVGGGKSAEHEMREKYEYPSDAVSPEPLQQQDEETRRKNKELHKAMKAEMKQEEIKAEDEKREIKTVSTKEFMEALGQMDNGGDDNGEEWDATKFNNEDKEID
jgi:serine/threonine protein kinase HipA of HipAB toxin-antitoxin module